MSNLSVFLKAAAVSANTGGGGGGGGGGGAWDLANCEYGYITSILWDVSYGRVVHSGSVASQELNPWALWFKPDGTKMYVAGTTGDDVNEYDLSTAWDVTTISFVQNASIISNTPTVRGLTFKPDGTKMYTVGTTSDAVHEYNLSTAWDVSTISFSQSFSVSSQETAPRQVFFKPDGLKMYVLGDTGNDVNEYSLTTAWDVSTASYDQNFSISSQDATPRGLFFKSDGTKMYVCGDDGNDINEYDLSTAWDISTASFNSNRLIMTSQTTSPNAIYFKPDGSRVFVLNTTSDSVFQYELGVDGFEVRTQETLPTGLWFKPDGTKMYVTGTNSDNLNEYNLSTAWDVFTASYSQAFSLAAQDATPEGIFFKSDGLKLYMVGRTGDNVYEYSLSTAWDVSTASYSQSFNVGSQATRPEGVFFKSDGTKMYVVDDAGDDVSEYNLNTAWDISTASYSQLFSFTSQETEASEIHFKSDGTVMYILGKTTAQAHQYSLSTAWDVSTASYSKSFSIKEQETSPRSFFFKPDGTQMFVTGIINDDVLVYNFS